jgi:uncharacterized membrane protein (UPF0182 family)
MKSRVGRFLLLAILIVLFFTSSKTIGMYVDWLFFSETGYEAMFTKVLSAEVLTGLVFGLIFCLFAGGNALFGSMVKVPAIDILFMGHVRVPFDPARFGRIFRFFGIAFALLGGAISAFWGSSLWPVVLSALHAVKTGKLDPIFGNDLGFYLFTLPLYQALNGYAAILIFLTTVLVAVGYAMRGGFLMLGSRVTFVKQAKVHLAFLVFLFFVRLAFGFYLDRFDTLYSPHTVITGAGYADVHAKLMALGALTPLTVIAGLVLVYALLKERLKLALYPVAGLVLVYIVGVAVYPSVLQSVKVAPNEQAMEEPFIKHHIALTKYGYNLEKVQMVPFDVSFNLTSKEIAKNDATIKNIRLWDEAPLLKTYSQLQQIRTYYRFGGIDTDRYLVNGEYRQVMLSARELSYNDLPSKSWINEKFVFTHGNGLVMGPASRISKEGLPEFIIKDIPPASTSNVKITTPEIYFGEMTSDYVIVNTKIPEFSYPTAEGNIYTTYKGSGGVRLNSLWRKALFSFHFGTPKIILSSEIAPESRIIYNRNVLQRVNTVAPFLVLDSNPYPVVADDGRIYWIVDGYTASDRLPYSKQLKNWVNYMRNSVKVVVDAYNGTTRFYVSDPEDVIIKVYNKIFPGAFRPVSEMPADLRRHIRYPRDLFKVQTAMYATYHMNDPKVFYNKEDLWEVPVHNEKSMEANYLIMKLPEEKREEFVLLVPYTPAKRDNLAAWFAARCDDRDYGKLLVFTFPRDRLVFGPRQVDARIDQDSFISQQLTLWGQRGSTVIRGKLLIIPVEKSLLYIQPIFLAAEDKGGLPELRRVVVAYENDVVMEENLEQALAVLFGKRKALPAAMEAGKPAAQPQKATIQDLAKEAAQAFDRAKASQRQGDWAAYGEQLKKLEQVLKQMTGK